MPTDRLVLRVYDAGGTATIHAVDGRFEHRRGGKPESIAELRNFHTLALYETNGELALLLHVVPFAPPYAATISIAPLELRLDVKLRCLLSHLGFLSLEATLRPRADGAVEIVDYQFYGVARRRRAVLPVVVSRDALRQINVTAEIAGGSIRNSFLDAAGLNSDDDGPERIQISFVDLPPIAVNKDPAPLVINFSRNPQLEPDRGSTYTLFGLTLPRNAISSNGSADTPLLVQSVRPRPPKVLDAIKKGDFKELQTLMDVVPWVVSLAKIHTQAFMHAWETIVSARFTAAIRGVQDGQRVSVVPMFTACACDDDPGWMVEWHAEESTYADRAPAADSHLLNPVSFIPVARTSATDDRLGSSAATSTRRGDTRGPRLWIALATVRPIAPIRSTGVFPLLRAHDGQPLAFSAEITPLRLQAAGTSEGVARFGIVFGLGKLRLLAKEPWVRLGALDLMMAETELPNAESRLQVRFAADSEDIAVVTTRDRHYAEIPLVDFKIKLPLLSVQPGGQDDPPGQETVRENATLDVDANLEREIAHAFRRDAPIIVPEKFRPRASRTAGTANTRLTGLILSIDETTAVDASRAVRMNLFNQRAEPTTVSQPSRVLVIDPDPFLVALLEFKPFEFQRPATQSAEIGRWENAGVEGATWQIQGGDEPFDLAFPSQSVGEEAEKRTIDIADVDRQRVGLSRRPLEYRFSPLARQRLYSSYSIQRFADPPWNLRRILGYSGQRAPGATVVHLQYELLYGLSCRVDAPRIRLGELFALVGDTRGAMRPRLEWTPSDHHFNGYQAARRRWADVYARCRARLAVYQPWDPGSDPAKVNHASPLSDSPEERLNSSTLVLTQGVSCYLRPEADLAYSTTPGPFEPNTFPRKRGGLEGGVTWGFESAAIYNELVRHPRTSSAALADPAFSALGGWGFQKASFAGDATTIYADVAMGRTFSYTLERIGRIGVCWNRAKHVIVYERSVLPSSQFVDEQEPLCGRPVLRKVREFVELLEPRRSFPEGNAAPVTRGFVVAADFKTKRIPVNSAWGTDVYTMEPIGDPNSQRVQAVPVGWKVPLWNPAARSDVYPKPEIFLDLVCDEDGRPSTTSAEIDDPEKLVFFTAIDQGSDTNAWAAVRSIDYPDLPRLEAHKDAFRNGALEPAQPADPPQAPGYDLFTFTLKPTAKPANLMAARSGQAMSAAIRNVTLVRADYSSKSREDRPRAEAPAAAAGQSATPAAAAGFTTLPPNERFVASSLALSSYLDHAFAAVRDVLPQDPTAIVDDTRFQAIKKKLKDLAADKASELNQFKVDLDEIVKAAEPSGLLAQFKEAINPDNIGKAEAQTANRFKAAADAEFKRFVDDFRSVMRGVVQQRPDVETLKRFIHDEGTALKDRLLALPGAPEAFRKVAQETLNAMRAFAAAIGLPEESLDRTIVDDVRRLTSADRVAQRVAELRARFDRTVDQVRDRVSRVAHASIPDVTALIDAVIRKFRPTFLARLSELERLHALLVDARARGAAAADLDKLESDFLAGRNRVVADLLKAKDEALKVLEQFHPDLPVLETKFATAAKAFVETLREAAEGIATAGASFEDRWKKFESSLDLARSAVNLPDVFNEDAVKAMQASAKKLAEEFSKQRDELRTELTKVAALLTSADPLAQPETLANALGLDRDLLKVGVTVGELRRGLVLAQENVVKSAHQFADGLQRMLPRPTSGIFQQPDNVMRMVRAFGEPPAVPNLSFTRPNLAYLFDEAKPYIDMTPVVAQAHATMEEVARQAESVLRPLGTLLPTARLGEDLIPFNLQEFDLSSVLPNFAGVDLRNLFSNVKLPSTANDGVKISHGVDPQTKRAWLEADVDFNIGHPTNIFSFGPLSVQLPDARFRATSRVEAAASGVTRKTNGRISGDWQLQVGGTTFVTFAETTLSFDDNGGIRFDVTPEKVRLAGILSFVEDFLKGVSDPTSGFSIGMLLDGFQSILSLPIPDIQIGTFGMSNLHLGAYFSLRLSDPDFGQFTLAVGAFLGRRQAPFSMTVFILGGGGWIDIQAKYAPLQQRVVCHLSVGITVSASLAIALGPIRGGVYVYFGITIDYHTGQSLMMGVMFLIRGCVSLLGIVSASISLLLEARYASGKLIGRGTLSVSIKICWCFTLEINQSVEYSVGGGSEQRASRIVELGRVAAAGPLMSLPMAGSAIALQQQPRVRRRPDYHALAQEYVDLMV